MKQKLSKVMTLSEFETGYWYADEIKAFAKDIGIKSTIKLRKDELEDLIRHFLKTGEIMQSQRKTMVNAVEKDTEIGLRLDLSIRHYTSNKITKEFIEKEALKIQPKLKRKSGARFRLNRWREEQLAKGKNITYGDLVNEYIRLNQHEGSFEQARSGRYINFLANYLDDNPKSGRHDAIRAWHHLKQMNIEKTYTAWKIHKKSKID